MKKTAKFLPERPLWFIRSGEEVFACSPPTEAAMTLARVYILQNNFTSDDVKIMQNGSSVRVIAKKDLELKI